MTSRRKLDLQSEFMAAMSDGLLDLSCKNLGDVHVPDLIKNIKQNSYGI